jgi:hypothetical protein
MLSFLAGHMIDLAINALLLRLWPRLVSCSRNRLPIGALPGKVARHVALKTFTDTRVSLGWGILHRLSYWTRWLLELQIRLLLLHIQSSCLLLRVLHLKTRSLHQEILSLHLKWMALTLHWWVTHLQCYGERARLRYARPSVAS